MKKINLLISLSVLLFSCKEQKNNNAIASKKDSVIIVDNTSPESNRIEFTEKPQQFKVSSTKVSEIKGKAGLKITVDPSALETINGRKLGGEIDIDLKEITNQEQLFKNDAPTVSNGRLLISGGAYYIGMSSNGNELKLKANKKMVIQVPSLTKKDMELFYGVKDSNGILNWIPANNKFTSQNPEPVVKKEVAKSTAAKSNVKTYSENKYQRNRLDEMMSLSQRNGGRMSMRELDSVMKKEYKEDKIEQSDYSESVTKVTDSLTNKKITKIESAYYRPLEIENLGWINCDRFNNNPNKTKILCDYDSTNKISTMSIYVIFKNINSMIKENVTLDKNASSFILDKDLPVGESVTLIACFNKGGKFFNCKQRLDLKENEKLKLVFTEVASADLIKKSYSYNY